jgi:hypothetical protein
MNSHLYSVVCNDSRIRNYTTAIAKLRLSKQSYDFYAVRAGIRRSELLRAVVSNLSCSRVPRRNFSSTFYPQSCWCMIQVILNTWNKWHPITKKYFSHIPLRCLLNTPPGVCVPQVEDHWLGEMLRFSRCQSLLEKLVSEAGRRNVRR